MPFVDCFSFDIECLVGYLSITDRFNLSHSCKAWRELIRNSNALLKGLLVPKILFERKRLVIKDKERETAYHLVYDNLRHGYQDYSFMQNKALVFHRHLEDVNYLDLDENNPFLHVKSIVLPMIFRLIGGRSYVFNNFFEDPFMVSNATKHFIVHTSTMDMMSIERKSSVAGSLPQCIGHRFSFQNSSNILMLNFMSSDRFLYLRHHKNFCIVDLETKVQGERIAGFDPLNYVAYDMSGSVLWLMQQRFQGLHDINAWVHVVDLMHEETMSVVVLLVFVHVVEYEHYLQHRNHVRETSLEALVDEVVLPEESFHVVLFDKPSKTFKYLYYVKELTKKLMPRHVRVYGKPLHVPKSVRLIADALFQVNIVSRAYGDMISILSLKALHNKNGLYDVFTCFEPNCVDGRINRLFIQDKAAQCMHRLHMATLATYDEITIQ